MNKPERYVSTAEIATELGAELHKYSEEKSAIRWLSLKSQIRQAIARLRLKAQEENSALTVKNAKLEKLNSAALEQLSYHACPAVPSRNNYGQPCNDSDDCVACWREYLGGKDV